MKYVKFTSKPGQWFKEGMEVYWCSCHLHSRRPTEEEYEKFKPDNAAMFAGVRVCEDNPYEIGNGYKVGDERWDGEWCPLDEFEIELVDEPKTLDDDEYLASLP